MLWLGADCTTNAVGVSTGMRANRYVVLLVCNCTAVKEG